MSNDIAKTEAGFGDDGFNPTSPTNRVNRGSFLKWTDNSGWVDRDGLPPPKPVLLIAINEGVQSWKDNKPETITDKPLPDVDELNAAIPQNQWELSIDGKPRKPWSPIVIFYFVDPRSGALFTFTSPTVGARIAYDSIKEKVVTMRMLRGTKVMPVVELTDRPMKTAFGLRKRPHLEVVGWKEAGGSGDPQVVASKPTPQLSSPAPKPAPQSRAKPADDTLAAMGDVKPVTAGEILDDEIPW